MTTITDADREAFARLDGNEPGDMGWRMITEPTRGDCAGVHEMAKHRIASTEALTAENERLREAMQRQASAVRTLHANEQTEINMLRAKNTEAHRAVMTLDSERQANALLTAEVTSLTARVAVLEGALREIGEATKRCQLPLTNQVNDIVCQALSDAPSQVLGGCDE